MRDIRAGETATITSSEEAGKKLAMISGRVREVLELGGEGFTSKEIGRILDISPHTVDQRFMRARALIGGDSRRDTSRIYKTLASAAGYEESLYQPLSIAGLDQTQPPEPETERYRPRVADAEGDAALEDPTLLSGWDFEPKSRSWLPFPAKGGSRNDLTVAQRIFWLALICLASIYAIRTLVEALSEIGGILRRF